MSHDPSRGALGATRWSRDGRRILLLCRFAETHHETFKHAYDVGVSPGYSGARVNRKRCGRATRSQSATCMMIESVSEPALKAIRSFSNTDSSA